MLKLSKSAWSLNTLWHFEMFEQLRISEDLSLQQHDCDKSYISQNYILTLWKVYIILRKYYIN